MTSCEHCPDGHEDPAKRPWSVFVSEDRDSDGQPTHLYVCPSGGGHVSESDAQWLRKLIQKYRQPQNGPVINIMNPPVTDPGEMVRRIMRQRRGFGDGTASRA